jgi:hypothetical protein
MLCLNEKSAIHIKRKKNARGTKLTLYFVSLPF